MRKPDRIIRLQTVLARTGLSRSTIYRKIAEGTFPAHLKISTNGTGWHESDINRWIADPAGWCPNGEFNKAPFDSRSLISGSTNSLNTCSSVRCGPVISPGISGLSALIGELSRAQRVQHLPSTLGRSTQHTSFWSTTALHDLRR
jgi:prophage regulatory protein